VWNKFLIPGETSLHPIIAKLKYQTIPHLFIDWHKIIIHPTLTLYLMSNLLYAIAVILIIAWLLGFFVYSLGSVIHILLVIAVIAILLRLIRGDGI